MMALSQSKWSLRGLTLVVWALAAASVAYWGLRLLARPGALASVPLATSAPFTPDPAIVARLLGATPAQAVPQASLASRFALSGVVAGAPGGGAALIAVDGKPARPFRVGSLVEEGLVLQSASARQATLGETRNSPALVTLDMPSLSK
jgi:general secretion pathway protein C